MVEGFSVSSQFKIEAQLEEYRNPPDSNKTVREIFGEMDRWIMFLGPYQLFLNPLTREWFILDTFHDEWKPTGYSAGTIVFSLESEDIIISPVKSRNIPGILSPGLSLPTSMPEKELINCTNCGATLPSSAKFCRKCGSPVNEVAP